MRNRAGYNMWLQFRLKPSDIYMNLSSYHIVQKNPIEYEYCCKHSLNQNDHYNQFFERPFNIRHSNILNSNLRYKKWL